MAWKTCPLCNRPFNERPRLLTPAEVAKILHVDPKTVARWDVPGGQLRPVMRTAGGHRRYSAEDVEAFGRPVTAAGPAGRLDGGSDRAP